MDLIKKDIQTKFLHPLRLRFDSPQSLEETNSAHVILDCASARDFFFFLIKSIISLFLF